MSKFFVEHNQIKEKSILIIGSDVNHIKNVLRCRIGDEIVICDNDEHINYVCQIVQMSKDNIECQIINQSDSEAESNIQITVFQGLPKADKMELIIQKGTELGVSNFVPVNMKRSIVKVKDFNKKIERWQKIAEIASKQSGRDIIPKVSSIIDFEQLCDCINDYDLIFLAYENEQNYTLRQLLQDFKFNSKHSQEQNVKIAFIVGPEGGIDLAEYGKLSKLGVKSITLGKRILRTETVAIVIAGNIMYELDS